MTESEAITIAKRILNSLTGYVQVVSDYEFEKDAALVGIELIKAETQGIQVARDDIMRIFDAHFGKTK